MHRQATFTRRDHSKLEMRVNLPGMQMFGRLTDAGVELTTVGSGSRTAHEIFIKALSRRRSKIKKLAREF